MKNNTLLVCFYVIATTCSSWVMSDVSSDIYVSLRGQDSEGRGSLKEPFHSIGYALKRVKPGQTIFIRGGEYREQSVVEGVRGTADNPITIKAYPGELVTFNGTLPLSAITDSSKWQRHNDKLFKVRVNIPVWQAFSEGKAMVPARWPNAHFSDGSIYSRDVWAKGIQGKVKVDSMSTDPKTHDLAATNFDITGALVIANTGSFTTWTRRVRQHKAGQNTFKHDPVPRVRGRHPYYYLEGKLDFLDQSDEWFYDVSEKMVYVSAPEGKMPKNMTFKFQSYALVGERWSHVVIQGINFLATTYRCNRCNNITIEDSNFRFASASKRMLGEIAVADMTELNSDKKRNSGFILRNCLISDTDSQALLIRGNQALVENCDFINIDYAVTDSEHHGESIHLNGKGSVFRRNTLFNAGGSSALSATSYLTTEYNDFSNTGFAQSDGALIHIRIPSQTNSITRYNWCHDTPKYGIRFDAPIPPVRWGNNGLIHHNVVWNSGGIMVKGEDHQVFHNLAFSNKDRDIRILDDTSVGGGGNKGTFTANNVADSISGDRKKDQAILGKNQNNFDGKEKTDSVLSQLRDPVNRDFRPKQNSKFIDGGIRIDSIKNEQGIYGNAPDLGPYEVGAKHYWIPGRQRTAASNPIPSDGAQQVDKGTDLIWLQAYRADTHFLYLGKDREAVASAGKASPAYKGVFTDSNIFDPEALESGEYYWRVDAMVDGRLVKGSIWRFKAH